MQILHRELYWCRRFVQVIFSFSFFFGKKVVSRQTCTCIDVGRCKNFTQFRLSGSNIFYKVVTPVLSTSQAQSSVGRSLCLIKTVSLPFHQCLFSKRFHKCSSSSLTFLVIQRIQDYGIGKGKTYPLTVPSVSS